ncbi:hypothetical protein [Mumia sp. DW29H23]|uniref:hypothetical protein n=1 Tax=Mumia sp. DW29H23 TaxID=3421241 RepID=UPI003D68D0B3
MTAQTGGDHVGTLAQEALKLARVLAQQASEGAHGADDGTADAHRPEACDYCPLCQMIAVVRHARPEVAEHLASALTSLTLAARGVVDAWAQSRPQGEPGQTADAGQDIDVEDESWE